MSEAKDNVPCCPCGQPIPDEESENSHFVFSVRPDGSRSNLGFCPVIRGMSGAVSRARGMSDQGIALYRGRRM